MVTQSDSVARWCAVYTVWFPASIGFVLNEMMEWNKEKGLQLIDEYQNSPVLWNSNHGFFYNENKKNEAWRNMDEILGCSPGEAKKKMDTILESFIMEKTEQINSLKTEKGNFLRHLTFKWWSAKIRLLQKHY